MVWSAPETFNILARMRCYQVVTRAQRVHVCRVNSRAATNIYILTVSTHTVPSSIKDGYIQLSVKPFIPDHLWLLRCQRYGHHKGTVPAKKVEYALDVATMVMIALHV